MAAAFSSDSLGVGKSQLKPVERLFDAIVAATAENDDEAFAEQIDAARLLNEMWASGVISPAERYDENLLLNWVQQGLCVPVAWTEYKIVHVHRQPSRKGAIVYSYFFDAAGAEYKMRWWITRGSGEWKAYDWDVLDHGLRNSKMDALYLEHGGEFRLEQYLDCCNELRAAERLIANDRYDEAAETIRRTEGYRVLRVLRDDAWLRIGNVWNECGRFSEGLACFQRVASPVATPGAIFGHVRCYHARGQHALGDR